MNHNNLINKTSVTGELEDKDYKIIEYPFDKYLLKIALTVTNEFLAVVEIKINKDFLTYKEKIINQSHYDVDEYYNE